ncbi:MAG: QVPTGV class sortase B protein-sorting domain-containing protein, partial [Ruminococcus sp.]|nr:QVPTGV class sortase B protein-sorting domain-containing protein [Ruminococcus sp.]
ISFPVGTFTKPGVYRFVINETNNNLPGVTYDSNPTRYLDVFVVANNNNELSVNSYVLRDAATDIGINGAYVENPDVKSSGYTNSLTQYDFDFSKTIAGNQGDKNKRFDFTLNITGANPGTYRVITNDVTGNPTSITVGANGTATGEYSLTNGSTVQVIGLNAGAVCTVTEDAEDYTATHRLDSGNAVSGESSGAVTLNSDHSVAFTNTRNGVIPTGVIMTIAPFAIGICVFGAIIIFIICRRKRRNY